LIDYYNINYGYFYQFFIVHLVQSDSTK